MKTVATLFVYLTFLLGLVACGGGDPEPGSEAETIQFEKDRYDRSNPIKPIPL